jgi:hypothetical protein
MRIRRPSRINLRQLILLLAVFSAAVMLAGGMAGAYQVQRQQLMLSTLDANEAFAAKLARTTSDLLLRAQSNLAYAAELMVRSGMSPDVQQTEVDRLHHLDLGFNTVTVVDMRGIVRAAAPEALNLRGRQLDTSRWRDLVDQRAVRDGAGQSGHRDLESPVRPAGAAAGPPVRDDVPAGRRGPAAPGERTVFP